MNKIRIILFLETFALWLLLSGSIDLEHVAVAVALGVLVSYLTADLFSPKLKVFREPKRYCWLVYYIGLFIWECIKANIDGAYRVIHPQLPINPGIVKVKTTLQSNLGLTFLANSLTLKPGTMTVDVDKEGGFLYIHWANVEATDVDKATELIVRKFETVLKRVFE